MLRIPKSLRDEMLTHLKAGAPNEACGILAGLGDVVTKAYPAPNADDSPKTYSIAPVDMLRIMNDMDDNGLEMLASFHSHPATPAYPSPTDVNRAGWPELRYIIVSLASDPPVMRAFRIENDIISEEEIGE